MNRQELLDYLNAYLNISGVDDYGPQGLQVESDNDQIHRIGLAVDTCPAAIEAAVAWGADMMLVHHGILWEKVEAIAGPLGMRVRMLLKEGINLYSAHLPLDAHAEVGNNAILAKMLGVTIDKWWCPVKGTDLGVCGSVRAGMTLTEFVKLVNEKLNVTARISSGGPDTINRAAIVPGFAPD